MTLRRPGWLFEVVAALGVAMLATADASPARGQSPAPVPELGRIKAHVVTLAGRDYEGRRAAGGRRAADYVLGEFKDLALEPLFDGDYVQSIPAREGGGEMGRNIGAMLRGGDPALKNEWIIISAHFDHLGMRGETLYPGADDNASGVAMLLEVARCFVQAAEKPKRSVMFIGFDLEEVGLFGSRYFVEHSPAPLEKVSLFITADMIGRSLGGVCGDRVFVMGSENAPGLRPWIDGASKGLPLTTGLLGSDLLLISRSDYGPFRARKVPYLFFSTGENPAYHTPSDVPETLDYPKVEAISRLILGIARKASEAAESPEWTTSSPPDLKEAETLQGVLRTLLENRDALKIGGAQNLLMRNTLRSLDAIVKRGTFTAEERVAVLRAVRIILITVF